MIIEIRDGETYYDGTMNPPTSPPDGRYTKEDDIADLMAEARFAALEHRISSLEDSSGNVGSDLPVTTIDSPWISDSEVPTPKSYSLESDIVNGSGKVYGFGGSVVDIGYLYSKDMGTSGNQYDVLVRGWIRPGANMMYYANIYGMMREVALGASYGYDAIYDYIDNYFWVQGDTYNDTNYGSSQGDKNKKLAFYVDNRQLYDEDQELVMDFYERDRTYLYGNFLPADDGRHK